MSGGEAGVERSKVLETRAFKILRLASLAQDDSAGAAFSPPTRLIFHCLPLSVYRSLFTVHCSPFTVHRSLFTVHCLPFTVHCSLFTVHRSLFTVHCSLSNRSSSSAVSAICSAPASISCSRLRKPQLTATQAMPAFLAVARSTSVSPI